MDMSDDSGASSSEDDLGETEHPTINTKRLSNLVQEAAGKNSKARVACNSLAQLKLANMRLHGREDDLKYLRSKLINLAKRSKANANTSDDSRAALRPELIFISGVSGVGKSVLVVRGLRDPAETAGIAFASGKFDLHNAASPLQAFGDAMTALTSHVMKHKCVDDIKGDIRKAFGEDDTIVRAMPGCADLFSFITNNRRRDWRVTAEGNHHPRKSLLAPTKESISRLQYAIRKLLKIICIHLKGVVLFIDDLQWSDAATLDLLKSISLDRGIASLLLVGAYREDEVPETHPLAIHIRDFKEQSGDSFITIRVGNLAHDSVTNLVAEALGMEGDEDTVEPLSTIIHTKTGGNAFFVLIFLKSLHEEDLIKFNFACMQWLWDDNDIKTKLVTENIATAVIRKLKRLEQVHQEALKIASCLGAKFSIST